MRLPRKGAIFSASSTSNPGCTRPEPLFCEPLCFCAPDAGAGKPAASTNPSNRVFVVDRIPRVFPNVTNGFIVPNDILERAVRTFIVSVECACYIQSGRGRTAGGISKNEKALRRTFASAYLVSIAYDSQSSQQLSLEKITYGFRLPGGLG